MRVYVPGHPELSADVRVEADGQIRIAEAGAVPAATRTTADLGNDLARRYRILFPDVSEVFVSVLQYNSRSIDVVGEVRNPGTFGFRIIPDLVQVVLKAGGPTPIADLSNIQVVRKNRAEGDSSVVSLDLSAGLVEADPATLPALEPGDTIIIPAAEQMALTGDTYQVLGSVAAPGVYRLRGETTLVKALAAAGGPGPNANLQKVHLTRATNAGLITYRVDLQSHLAAGKPGAGFDLQPGDTILVSAKGSFWGDVFRGFLAIAPIVTAISTLTIALR